MRIHRFLSRIADEFVRFVKPGELSTIFQSPINWHNLRAAWLQSDPNWLNKILALGDTDFLTEEDFAEYEKLMKEMS